MATVPDLSLNYAQNAPGIDPHVPYPGDGPTVFITTQTITLGAASVQSAPFSSRTNRISITAKTAAARYMYGPAPQTATATSILLPLAVGATILAVHPGWVIAAMQDSAAGEMNIAEYV
jgi:hypothetical protein